MSGVANKSTCPHGPEAIRRLIEQALSSSSRKTGHKKSQKASDLADRAAERIVDKSMPPEEQERRKRALIKGPREFRNSRGSAEPKTVDESCANLQSQRGPFAAEPSQYPGTIRY
jgi:hypothetical protein